MKWQRAFNIYKLKWPVKSSRAYFPLVVLADSDQNIPRKTMIVPFSASTANDIHEVQGSPPEVVRQKGVEPLTLSPVGRFSIQLSYWRLEISDFRFSIAE